MRRFLALLKFLGRWLGPALLLAAAYLFVVPLGPFLDFAPSVALAGAIVSVLAALLARGPQRRRQRILLVTAALIGLGFFGWRSAEDRRGYREEIVGFDNRGAHLVGTLYLPDRPGKVPGIVWVHGSGDKPRSAFTAEAVHFARSGYAVLVYDKRGAGESTGRFNAMTATSPENLDLLASDAAAALALLSRRREVRADAAGFVGVSEAGWVVPRAALLNGKAAFMLLLSGPVTSTHAFLRYERFHLGAFDKPTFALARKAMGRGDIPEGMTADQAFDLAQRRVTFDRAYGDFDPVNDLAKLDVPGLWLMADQDWTVPPGPSARNLDALRGRGKPYSYRYIAGASHGMHLAPTAPVLEAIDTWLAQVTKTGR